MAEIIQPQTLIQRDGTSQAGRVLTALDPGYVSVDERTLRDWLEFAGAYASRLRYFDLDMQPSGNWEEFLGLKGMVGEEARRAVLDDLALMAEEPSRWAAAHPDAERPAHLLLFLAFLQTLRRVQDRLNGFTRRHLDYIYREVLGFATRGARTDQIHVLAELAAGQADFLLPAGTLLLAGKDAEDHDRLFRTDHDLVVNQAQVANLRSLFVQRRVIGLEDVRRDPEVLLGVVVFQPPWLHFASKANKSLLAMLDLAFRDPRRGVVPLTYTQSKGQVIPVDEALLADLDRLLEFVARQLYLPLPVFRALMETKRGLEVGLEPAASRWRAVNEALQTAGRKKRAPAPFDLPAGPPDDFPGNLQKALELPADAFNKLPEVNDIYGLYRHVDGPDPDVRTFIPERLFMSVEEFKAMMMVVDGFHRDWQRIHETLRGAGRRKQLRESSHRIQPTADLRAYDPKRWENLIQRNLGDPPYPQLRGLKVANFDQIFDEVGRLEACFSMPAEDFARVREILAKEMAARPWECEEVSGILRQAGTERIVAEGRAYITAARLPTEPASRSIEAMVRRALGHPKPDDPLPAGKAFLSLEAQRDGAYVRDELFLSPDSLMFLQGLASGPVASAGDWAAAASILEQAQRRKRGSVVLTYEAESWDNIYGAANATLVTAGSGLSDERSIPRWRTFGEGFRPDAATVAGDIGFMVGSPLLALAEGRRILILTVALAEDGLDRAALQAALDQQAQRPPLRCRLSGEEGWIEARFDQPIALRPTTVKGAAAALELRLRLDLQDPAVGPPAADSGLPIGLPLLQVLLADASGIDLSIPGRKLYTPFRTLKLVRVSLRVEVDGLADVALQNDESVLDARKPFEPFGNAPAVGARLLFAHPEISTKKLESLQVGIDWLGAPADLARHYLGYNEDFTGPIANNDVFVAGLKLRDHRALFDLKDVKLFPTTKPPACAHVAEKHAFDMTEAEIKAKNPGYSWDPQGVAGEEPLDWGRCWALELQPPDFRHADYPKAAARGATRMDGSTPPKPNPFILNPPYTPKIKRLRIYYRASVDIEASAKVPTAAGRLYHVEPFGFVGLLPAGDAVTVSFLPQYDDEGQLLIGIEGLEPPQNLSLLLQTAPGSADPDLAPEPVQWSCLDGDQWIDLNRGRVLSDTTANLVNSGIITFDLPPVRSGNRLPAALYWLRATIARRSRSVADLVDLRAQAVVATRVDDGQDGPRTERYLPPKSITGLVVPRAEIEAIHQPYSSQGGAPPEAEEALFRRASERIHHKDRALACWDYERAILEAFPEVYKVKCLPVGTSVDPRLVGLVRVILIPDIRGRLPFDPFEPKVPAETLRGVEAFLARRCAPLARVRVQNPRYATLQLRFSVRFRPGFNPGFYLKRLNEDLRRYLSPWAYDESADILFGGRITASLIVHFLEQRSYVDYLAGLNIFLAEDGGALRLISQEELEQRATDPNSADLILVSAREHVIDLITEEYYADESFVGINHMKIELDFRVA